MQADKRYYTTADRSRLVEEGDPDAAYLLAAEGAQLSSADIERYGIGKKSMPEPEPVVVHSIAADPPKDEEPAPAEDDAPQAKAVSAAPENKAQKRQAVEGK
jgi:hypothetical protein